MRQRSLAVAATGTLLGAFALFLVQCGGTGGGLGTDAPGGQTVNPSCNPENTCLDLTVADRFLEADGADETGFQATLRDGSGNPVDGVEICFRMEDPGLATIFEPVDGCELTNAQGLVSGRLRARRRTGSVDLIATATRLEDRERLRFGGVCLLDLTPNSGVIEAGGSEFLRACISCSDNTVLRGATVTFSGCPGAATCTLSPTSATTDNDGCAQTSLLNTKSDTTNEQVNITATEPTSGSDTSNFVLEGVEPVCGNGVVESGEACDDGNADEFDGCTTGCAVGPTCGNKIIESGEECEDGNRTPGDGCSANCQSE
jgi:cysteine-rich repeat protein